jgi:hypothetical protein
MHPNAPRAASAPRTVPASVTQQAPSYNPTPTFAVLPPTQPQLAPQTSTGQQSGIDLLGLHQAQAPLVSRAAPAQASSTDIFGVFGHEGQPRQTSAPPVAASTDMLGLFGDMTLGSQGQPQASPTQFGSQPPVAANQYNGGQVFLPQSAPPIPPQQQARGMSPTPPFSQGIPFVPPPQQPQYPNGGQQHFYPPNPPQGNHALSHSPTRQQQHPVNQGYSHQQPGAFAGGYQVQPGAAPAFAQEPNSGGYSPHPPQGIQQVQPYGYQQQGQAGAYGGQPPQQGGPFF